MLQQDDNSFVLKYSVYLTDKNTEREKLFRGIIFPFSELPSQINFGFTSTPKMIKQSMLASKIQIPYFQQMKKVAK